MLPDFELERSVSHETLAWSKEVLEIPNEYFNGLPACPYAKKAWADNRVGITFKYTSHWQDLYTLISTWDDSKDVVILVDFCRFLSIFNPLILANFCSIDDEI